MTDQEVFGNFLIPYIREKRAKKQTVKFFEIGLGCDGDKLYGGSLEIWNKLFSKQDNLWAADAFGRHFYVLFFFLHRV